jgi:hypothetical protein
MAGLPGGGAGLVELLPWVLLLGAAVVAVGASLLAWWMWRRTKAPVPAGGATETASDTEIRENLDGQIRAMLTQAGGSLDQTQIRENLGLSVSAVGAALRRLEDEGQITRLWQPDGYTYLVRTAG